MASLDVPECWISNGLSEKTKEKAREELGETDEKRTKALRALRQKIQDYTTGHPAFSFPRQDDAFLLRFLRSRKFNVDRAFALLLSYLTFREEHPDLFEGVTLESVRPALEYCLPMVLKDRDEEGRRVLIFQPYRIDPEKYSHLEVQRALVYALDALIEDEETQVNGFILIEDYVNMTMAKVVGLDQKLMKQITSLVQDAFPARFCGMHMVNQPWFFSILWNIARPFLKEKMKKRVKMHGSNLGSLHNYLPKRCLPAEVGGDLPAYSAQPLIDFLSKVKVHRPAKCQSTPV